MPQTGSASAPQPHGSTTTAPASLSPQQATTNTTFIAETARLRGKAAPFKIGETITPFVLYDQDARLVQLPTAFEGKFIIISFIFTRCQVATMCPAATSKMTQLQQAFAESGLADKVQLVSISFDPAHDTPEVMRQYAQMFGADTSNYSFLSGESKLTDALLRRFGILTRDANDTIVHTMTTSLIGVDGTLALQQSGAEWQIEPFFDAIRKQVSGR